MSKAQKTIKTAQFWRPEFPYNELPPLPPGVELEGCMREQLVCLDPTAWVALRLCGLCGLCGQTGPWCSTRRARC